MSNVIDPRSTATAGLSLDARADLLVVGAGPAGLAAAILAARHGKRVVLVDENPVPHATMGDDIPLHFGQRMSGAVRNLTAMTEAIVAAEPLLETALEAGVEIRLGTIVWGLYANGASVGWLPGKVAGLSDGETSTMLGFDAVIVATGRRDMGLAFPGWELPGVMGATAAERLARFGALGARRAIILGTSAEALATAGKPQEAEAAFEDIAKTGPAGYAHLARLRAAALLGASDPEAGGRAFDAIANDESFDPSMRDDARLRGEWVRVLEVRHRIAQDLHDNVMQRLFATGVGLQSLAASLPTDAANRLGRHVTDLDETIDEIRTRIFGLREDGSLPHGPAQSRFRHVAPDEIAP